MFIYRDTYVFTRNSLVFNICSMFMLFSIKLTVCITTKSSLSLLYKENNSVILKTFPFTVLRWRGVSGFRGTYLRVVGRLLDDLRGHPERCPDKRLSLDLCVCQLSRHTEVCQLHLTRLRQQHVGSCDRVKTRDNGDQQTWQLPLVLKQTKTDESFHFTMY